MNIFQIWFGGSIPEWRLDLMWQAYAKAEHYQLFVEEPVHPLPPEVQIVIPVYSLQALAYCNWSRRYAARGHKYAADIIRADIAHRLPSWWYVDTDIRILGPGADFDAVATEANEGPVYAPRSGGGGDIDLFYCSDSHHIGKVFDRLKQGGMPPQSVTPAVHVLADPGLLENEITLLPWHLFERCRFEGAGS